VGASMRGKRVVIVDDVITAGTAVRTSMAMLQAAGAQVNSVHTHILLSKLYRPLPIHHLGFMTEHLRCE
jgi:adenine/guanine phosphoribosyltransferase-like PRPP-binding protein